MVKMSNASYENEIHRVDRPFNEDSKSINFLARKDLISGTGWQKKLGKWPKTGNLLLYKLGSGQFY